MTVIVFCVKTEPVNGEVFYRNVDISKEVFYLGVTPRGGKLKPGIPMFVTADGTYLQLDNIENYQRILEPFGFDLLYSSCLVNVNLIDRIEVTRHGNNAFFKGGGKMSVPVSRPKTKEYPHLIVERFLDSILT